MEPVIYTSIISRVGDQLILPLRDTSTGNALSALFDAAMKRCVVVDKPPFRDTDTEECRGLLPDEVASSLKRLVVITNPGVVRAALSAHIGLQPGLYQPFTRKAVSEEGVEYKFLQGKDERTVSGIDVVMQMMAELDGSIPSGREQ